MSAFLREAEHRIFYAASLLAHWAANGARVLNGAEVIAVDSSKARQLSLISGLGLAVPETRAVHRAEDLFAAAAGDALPAAGQGQYRRLRRRHRPLRRAPEELAAAVADGTMPESVDSVLLVQDYVPARGGTIVRVETLGGRFLYAIEIESGGSFDLCPADACLAAPGRAAVAMRAFEPPPELDRGRRADRAGRRARRRRRRIS